MSPRAWDLRIEDMIKATESVKKFIDGYTFESFKNDEKTYLAVIRCLEIIGEAASHVPQEVQDKYSEVPWRKAKDFRNVLIHQYHGLSDQIIWKTATEELPRLEKDLKRIFDQL